MKPPDSCRCFLFLAPVRAENPLQVSGGWNEEIADPLYWAFIDPAEDSQNTPFTLRYSDSTEVTRGTLNARRSTEGLPRCLRIPRGTSLSRRKRNYADTRAKIPASHDSKQASCYGKVLMATTVSSVSSQGSLVVTLTS